MARILTGNVLDPINSASWFLMDIAWAAQFEPAAYPLMALTALSGAALLPAERKRGLIWINAALNCWIWLNVLWMVSDLRKINSLRIVALGVGGLGIILVVIGVFRSPDLQRTLAHFKRLRLLDRHTEP
jgi:hypothetical protein